MGQYLWQDYVQILTSSASICYLTVSVNSRLSCHPQKPKLVCYGFNPQCGVISMSHNMHYRPE